jgi:antirestriction protein
MKIAFFYTAEEAALVAQQLYKVKQQDNLLFFEHLDVRALKLSASLVDVEYEFLGAKCHLPFKPLNCAENVPQIYVACLSAYNSGYLHGMWIEATHILVVMPPLNNFKKIIKAVMNQRRILFMRCSIKMELLSE